MRVVVTVVAALVVVGLAGVGWLLTRPGTSKACTLGMSIDEVGGPTPEAARTRWASELDLDYDVEQPDEVGAQGDRVTAIYFYERPDLASVEGDRTYYHEVVTERRAEDDWRVVSANTCSSWDG